MTDPLHILAPVAVRNLMGALHPRLNAAAGRPVVLTFDLNPAIPRRIEAGEAYDIGLTNPPHARRLFSAGRADAASHRPFARAALAICRKAGTDRPVVTDLDGIVALMLAAQSIGYTAEGTSGRSYLDTVQKLGIDQDVATKSLPMATGMPVASVVSGAAEYAVVPLTTILSNADVTLAAVFPDRLDAHIDMSVFLSPAPCMGAQAVLDLLVSPVLDPELAAAGVTRFGF